MSASGDRNLTIAAAHLHAWGHLVQALSVQAEHSTAVRELSDAVAALRQDHGAKLDQITTKTFSTVLLRRPGSPEPK